MSSGPGREAKANPTTTSDFPCDVSTSASHLAGLEVDRFVTTDNAPGWSNQLDAGPVNLVGDDALSLTLSRMARERLFELGIADAACAQLFASVAGR